MRALIVEDEADVAADLAEAMNAAGFVADIARDGESAWFCGTTEDYDVVILDLGLPRLDGMTVMRRWRSEQRTFPIIILSASNDWTERIAGIEAGADDYLGKPFAVGELIARIRGLLRRAAGRMSTTVETGKWVLDPHRMSATRDGRPVRLSQLEFRCLNYLAHQPGRAVSSGELVEHLYGATASGDANAIEALVMRLRRKLGHETIETRRGFGYLLAGET